jgi:hypothetical protein
MNAPQHKLPGRLADLSPFDIKVTLETPKPLLPVRNAVRHEFLKGEAETDAGYGCVDWYQYPASRAEGARAAD